MIGHKFAKRAVLSHLLANRLGQIEMNGHAGEELFFVERLAQVVVAAGGKTIDAINILDRPIIVAYLLVVVLMFTIINLVVDLIYTLLDPRVRLQPDVQ